MKISYIGLLLLSPALVISMIAVQLGRRTGLKIRPEFVITRRKQVYGNLGYHFIK